MIKAGNNTYANVFVAGVNNRTENSEQLAYGSIVINNTDDMLEQIHQMENDMSGRNKMVASELANDGPSKKVNENNDDVMIIENNSEIQPETVPATEPTAAPASKTIESVEEKADATMVADVDRAANEANEKNETSFKKRKMVISTEKILQVLRCKGRAAAKGKMRSIMQRRSSNVSQRRSSVVKRKSSIARISFERKQKSIEPTSNPKPYKCVVDGCSYAGAHKRYLAAHMKRHNFHKLIDCTKCEKKFKSADHDALVKHLSEHE